MTKSIREIDPDERELNFLRRQCFEKLSSKAVYRGLQASSDKLYLRVDDKEIGGDSYRLPMALEFVDSFVQAALIEPQPPFQYCKAWTAGPYRHLKATRLAGYYLTMFSAIPDMEIAYDRFNLDPIKMAVIEKALHLVRMYPELKKGAPPNAALTRYTSPDADEGDEQPITSILRGWQVFNDFVADVRAVVKSKLFAKIRKRRRESACENFLSGCKHIDDLFDVHSRLIVLRLDLGYSKIAQTTSTISIRRAKEDMARLLKNRHSNAIFKDFVGYMWKLEYGVSKGYHFHCLFFLDGSEVDNHIGHAEALCNYWEGKLTEHEGLAINVNLHESRYAPWGRWGIGRVEHDDVEKRGILVDIVRYLTKSTQEVKVRSLEINDRGDATRQDEENFRAFGHGWIDERQSQAGRPRANYVPRACVYRHVLLSPSPLEAPVSQHQSSKEG